MTPEQQKYFRDWYHKQSPEVKKHRLSLANARNRRTQVWLREYKKTLKCIRCPESSWVALDFHHVTDKKTVEVALGPSRGWSIERIKKEIAKCIVLCANCHRKETYENKIRQ